MKKYISILGIFGSWIFFSANTLISGASSNAEGSIIYKIYWIVILMISIYLFIFDCKFKKKWSVIISIMPISLSIALFLTSFLIYGVNSDDNFYFFTLYIAQCVPCYLLGIHCKLNQNEENLYKGVELLSIISVFVLGIGLAPLVSGDVKYSMLTNVGGMSNMQIAYASMDMYIILFTYGIIRKNINKVSKRRKVYNYVRFPIILFLLFSIIATGTRGALIITILTPIVVLIIGIIKNNKVLIVKSFGHAILVGSLILIIVFVLDIEMIEFAINRILLFLNGSNNGEAWAGGSGRESLYVMATMSIGEHPFLGLGPLGFIDKYNTYPHNLILELMVDYGLFIGSVALTLLILLILKFFNISKRKYSTLIIFILFISELVKMLFSSTIFSNQILWFFIGYITASLLEDTNGGSEILINKKSLNT